MASWGSSASCLSEVRPESGPSDTESAQRLQRLFSVLEQRRPTVAQHSQRVMSHASAISVALRLTDQERRLIQKGALLHDVGKMLVTANILAKPGSLTSEEYTLMQEHAILGERMAIHAGQGDQIAKAVRHHHERWDGTGYPDGLIGAAISLPARIIAVANTFDTVIQQRPYAAPMSCEEACTELQRVQGRQLDATIVAAFLRFLEHIGARAGGCHMEPIQQIRRG